MEPAERVVLEVLGVSGNRVSSGVECVRIMNDSSHTPLFLPMHFVWKTNEQKVNA